MIVCLLKFLRKNRLIGNSIKPKKGIIILTIVFLSLLAGIVLGVCALFPIGLAKVNPESQTSQKLINGMAPQKNSKISFEDCQPVNLYFSHVKCGRFSPFSQMRYSLSFAVITPRRDNSELLNIVTEPVVYIDGGPGTGNLLTRDALEFWDGLIAESQLNRPLIIVNPHGVRGSDPHFDCNGKYAFFKNMIETHYAIERELDLYSEFSEQCILDIKRQISKDSKPGIASITLSKNKQHKDVFVDNTSEISHLNLFSSNQFVNSIQGLLTGLGYEKWHLWGASYGSRVALWGANSPNVLSVIADAPYFFHAGTFLHNIKLDLRGLHLLEKIYSKETQKSKKIPTEFLVLLDHALRKVQAGEYKIAIVVDSDTTHGASQQRVNVALTPLRLFEMAFFSLYNKQSTQAFIDLVEEIVTSKTVNITVLDSVKALLASYFYTFVDPNFSMFVYLATECADNGAADSNDLLEAQVAVSGFAENFRKKDATKNLIGNRTAGGLTDTLSQWVELSYRHDVCRSVGNEKLQSMQSRKYTSKPTLVLTGEYDPITPLDAPAVSALKSDIGFVHTYVAPGKRHGLLFGGACGSGLITEFLNLGKRFESDRLSFYCKN